MSEQEDTNDDVVYDEDQGAAALKKLRERLKTCEKEKKEYLDGWQRAQADMANIRAQHATALSESKKRALHEFVTTLLPVLDSFSLALKEDSSDAKWKAGIEQVHTQLLGLLEKENIVPHGATGDSFDPALHEAIAHSEGGESDTIAEVARVGYTIDGHVIRPAQVVIFS